MQSPLSPFEDMIRSDLAHDSWAENMFGLLQYQACKNIIYSIFLKCLGCNPQQMKKWSDFPALPVSAFRQKQVISFSPDEATLVFETSGTTRDKLGRHYMENARAYERALTIGFEQFMPPGMPEKWLSLIPPFATKPHSSLSYMVEYLARDREVLWLVGPDYIVDPSRFVAALNDAGGSPVFLLGTSSAWADICEWMTARDMKLSLACGSVIFDTGGFKKRGAVMEPQQLWRLLSQRLDVPLERIMNEYGMTELSSPCYASAADGIHRVPRTLRVRLIHPATGRDAEPGERGLVHLYDLANIHSVGAIATEDVAIRVGDGFRLLGRCPTSPARGCSLPYGFQSGGEHASA